jgi:hypothetical protein
MTRVIEKTRSPRIVIADDAGLIYSDDWRRGWIKGFRDLHCNVSIVDISSLRRAMGGGPYSVRGQGNAAALADAIVSHKPDLIWCHHGRAASNEFFLSKFRRRGIPTAVYLCDEPYEVGETARYSPRFDFVFSMDWCTLETHKQARAAAHRGGVFYLPPCADEDLFVRRGYEARNVPAFFLGNPTLIPREPWLRAVEAAVPGADVRYWPKGGRPVEGLEGMGRARRPSEALRRLRRRAQRAPAPRHHEGVLHDADSAPHGEHADSERCAAVHEDAGAGRHRLLERLQPSGEPRQSASVRVLRVRDARRQ